MKVIGVEHRSGFTVKLPNVMITIIPMVITIGIRMIAIIIGITITDIGNPQGKWFANQSPLGRAARAGI